MIEKGRWIDRKFEFGMTIDSYPCIIERLRGTPARIEELIVNISEDQLLAVPKSGWTIKEHIGHLISVESLFEDRFEQFSQKLPELIPADMTNQDTEKASYTNIPIADILSTFRKVRTQFVKRLESVDNSIVAHAAFHPRLKKLMRLIDMTFFLAEHDDNHLADIVRLSRLEI